MKYVVSPRIIYSTSATFTEVLLGFPLRNWKRLSQHTCSKFQQSNELLELSARFCLVGVTPADMNHVLKTGHNPTDVLLWNACMTEAS